MPHTSGRSPLLRHIQYHAKQRVKLRATFAGSAQPYNRWLWLVASEFGLSYGQLLSDSELMNRYYDFSFSRGFWKEPIKLFYKPDVFTRQLDTLVASIGTGQSVAQVAGRRGVNFHGFEFSISLLDVIVWRTASLPIFDFTGLDARSSVITQSWAICCERYAGADLENCKFVDVFCDPAVGPGTNIFRGDFRNANLSGADFRRAYLKGSDFHGANLHGADFRCSERFDCKFEGATGINDPFAFSECAESHKWLMRCDAVQESCLAITR